MKRNQPPLRDHWKTHFAFNQTRNTDYLKIIILMWFKAFASEESDRQRVYVYDFQEWNNLSDPKTALSNAKILLLCVVRSKELMVLTVECLFQTLSLGFPRSRTCSFFFTGPRWRATCQISVIYHARIRSTFSGINLRPLRRVKWSFVCCGRLGAARVFHFMTLSVFARKIMNWRSMIKHWCKWDVCHVWELDQAS